jgi:hypothetical protein
MEPKYKLLVELSDEALERVSGGDVILNENSQGQGGWLPPSSLGDIGQYWGGASGDELDPPFFWPQYDWDI